MKRNFLTVLLVTVVMLGASGQEQKSDTVIVSLARTSKVIFTMEDRSDLEILKHYNFQELFNDILARIETSDTTAVEPLTTETIAKEETPAEEDWKKPEEVSNERDDEDDEEWNQKVEYRRGRIGHTWQSFNFDLGTNNYLSDGKFPDTDNALYSVRPWGSWYIGTSSVQRTRVGRNFFLEWGVGLSWYNFKFQNDAVVIQKNDDGIVFLTDLRDVNHNKSKLTASYINASFVPVIDFNDHSRKPRMWDGYGNSFRIGIGPYVGYRISSRSKLVYTENGHRETEKERNNFYLNNFRYGARLQLGFRNTDLFFNYDLNELFSTGKGPQLNGVSSKLNAFSFGVIF